ncbi:MAG: TIM-barrel domain-containing protein, partial [Candidatus Ornithospirochaeta sp.]
MNNLSFSPTITETKGIILEIEGEIISIEAFGRNAVRVRASRSLHLESPLWTLLPQPRTEPRIVVLKNRATLSTEGITASIDELGTLEFLSPEGHVILRESWVDTRVDHAPVRRAREYRTIASNSFRTWQYFETSDDEHFYGLGQMANGHLDQKGMKIDLMQKNGRVSIPYILSSKGYGLIWNTPSIGSVTLGRDVVEWHSECQSQIDYIVVGGGTPEKINQNFTAMTGRAKALPEWATGLWQSRLRYTTQSELESVLSGYVDRGINLSTIVIDYFHWPVQGSWKFDEKYWPDVEGMARLAKKYGVKILVSVWPTVDPRSENHKAMKSSNMLIRAEEGVDVFFMVMGPEGIIDVTNPKTREFVWKKL